MMSLEYMYAVMGRRRNKLQMLLIRRCGGMTPPQDRTCIDDRQRLQRWAFEPTDLITRRSNKILVLARLAMYVSSDLLH
jgi:hypothetical protein